MSVVTYATNTTTPTLTVENFLSNVNISGVFVLSVDTVNMVAGDVLEIRAYKMVVTATAARVEQFYMYNGVQPTDDQIKVTIPLSNVLTDAQALRFSIKQTFGVARAFPWTVERHV